VQPGSVALRFTVTIRSDGSARDGSAWLPCDVSLEGEYKEFGVFPAFVAVLAAQVRVVLGACRFCTGQRGQCRVVQCHQWHAATCVTFVVMCALLCALPVASTPVCRGFQLPARVARGPC
jgi:hypothetical protein